MLKRNGRITLLQCRRWKVNQVGVGPLQELHDALERNDAYNAISIAAGDFSDAARRYAAGKPMVLLYGQELAKLLGRASRK